MTLFTGNVDRESRGPGATDGNKPRIVIFSASVGSGHVRAAKAIESALGTQLPDATIAHVDALDLTNGAFRRATAPGISVPPEARRGLSGGCMIFWIIPTTTARRQSPDNSLSGSISRGFRNC